MTLSRSNAKIVRFREDMNAATQGRVFINLKLDVVTKDKECLQFLILVTTFKIFLKPARDQRGKGPGQRECIKTCERYR